MAIFDAYVPVNMNNNSGGIQTSVTYSDNSLIFSESADELYAEAVLGSFTYDSFGNLVEGTVYEIIAGGREDVFFDYEDWLYITGLNADVVTTIGFLATGDNQGLWAYFFGGNDQFYGSDFTDQINSYAGNDLIYGYQGNDRLYGMTGSDTIIGGSGNDLMIGGSGVDKLTGGLGNDTYLFNSALSSTNVDTIFGFSHVSDVIKLDDDYFKKLFTGRNHTLPATQYKENTTGRATDADDRIIYNNSNGYVYYDPDGTGPAAHIRFAVISGSPDNVDSTDFFVVT